MLYYGMFPSYKKWLPLVMNHPPKLWHEQCPQERIFRSLIFLMIQTCILWSILPKTLNINNDATLLLSVTWVVDAELWYFKLFPEVIYVDATSHTNFNLYHLLTFSCRSSAGHQVTFLRMWIPDQKRSTFRL